MRRKVAWVIVLLVVAALAAPAVAAPRVAGTGSVYGQIVDSTTGHPFNLLEGESIIGVDVFNLGTMERTRLWIQDTQAAQYEFAALAAGQYKMRFRYWDADNNFTSYRWYNNGANFDVATQFTIVPGAALEIDVTLRPMAGAAVSGTLVERGTGLPLTGCYTIELFEAAGISLGWVTDSEVDGTWSLPFIPAGRYAALGVMTSSPSIAGCEAAPVHLDSWHGGASGWPLRSSNLVAHQATFTTADTFRVIAGVDVIDIEIEMLPAPTCRGKAPTIFGTTLADTINGTPARDVISGLAGDDILNGRAGNDLLCGDTGDDSLTGGLGLKDIAVGGRGIDACNADTAIGCEITP